MSATLGLSEVSRLVESALGDGRRPTVLHVREVPVYEVDFSSLLFADEYALPALEKAVLGLVGALGAAGVEDVAAYLGLPTETVQSTVRRLREGLLLADRQPADGEAAPPPSPPPATGFAAWLKRLMGATGGASAPQAPAAPRPTLARAVLARTPSELVPHLTLTEAGEAALRQGKAFVQREVPAQLLVWGAPLHLVGTKRELKSKHAAARRERALPPDEVPEALRTLDEDIRLETAERFERSGIGDTLEGYKGRLVACPPNVQWEVRRSTQVRSSLLVVAGFAAGRARGLEWVVLTGSRGRLERCMRLEGERLPLSVNGLRAELLDNACTAAAGDARRSSVADDGALVVAVGLESLRRLMPPGARPQDAWVTLPATEEGWATAGRVRAIPDNVQSARGLHLDWVCQRTGELRRDLGATNRGLWDELQAYWQSALGPPPDDESLIAAMWSRPEMRALVCERRLQADLIVPYRRTEAA